MKENFKCLNQMSTSRPDHPKPVLRRGELPAGAKLLVLLGVPKAVQVEEEGQLGRPIAGVGNERVVTPLAAKRVVEADARLPQRRGNEGEQHPFTATRRGPDRDRPKRKCDVLHAVLHGPSQPRAAAVNSSAP